MAGKRCGCGGECGCVFQAGPGVRLDGLLLEVTAGRTRLLGSATDTIETKIPGSGTTEDPYRVSMVEYAGARQQLIYTFKTPGVYTWAKPSFGTLALVTVLGGGGGGGGGGGMKIGAGGAAGIQILVDALLSDLDSEVSLSVGAGGSGGYAPGGASGPGVPGTESSFHVFRASGGAGGGNLVQSGDPRYAALGSYGGFGGLAKPDPFVGVAGLDGAPPYGGFRNGGAGAAPTVRVTGEDGGGTPELRRPLGTGGGGGIGALLNIFPGGGGGGNGGPGAGGGGGGSNGSGVSTPGGRGGDGVVLIVIQ